MTAHRARLEAFIQMFTRPHPMQSYMLDCPQLAADVAAVLGELDKVESLKAEVVNNAHDAAIMTELLVKKNSQLRRGSRGDKGPSEVDRLLNRCPGDLIRDEKW